MEKVDDKAALINLYYPKASDSLDQSFFESSRFSELSPLYLPSACIPRSYNENEWGKIETIPFVTINSRLFALSYGVHCCVGTIPS